MRLCHKKMDVYSAQGASSSDVSRPRCVTLLWLFCPGANGERERDWLCNPAVPQGSFNLEVLKVCSDPQWFLRGKLKEAWSDRKKFQFVGCVLSDKCLPCKLPFSGSLLSWHWTVLWKYGGGIASFSDLGVVFLLMGTLASSSSNSLNHSEQSSS